VVLQSSDAQGTASFTGATNWSNAAVPSAANDYVDNGFILRTPADGSAHTFAGGSLTVSNAPTAPPLTHSSAVLAYKGFGSTITIGTAPTNGLFLDNAYLASFQCLQAWTFGGFITLKAGGGLIEPQTGTMTVSAKIGGPGPLAVFPTGSTSLSEGGTVVLTGSNSYSGGTAVNGTYILQAGNSNALGSATGSLSLVNGSAPSLDLNGNSISIGNLSGVSGARIFNSATNAAPVDGRRWRCRWRLVSGVHQRWQRTAGFEQNWRRYAHLRRNRFL